MFRWLITEKFGFLVVLGAVSGMIKGAVGNATSLLTGEASHPLPINAPLSAAGIKLPGGPGDAVYQAANSRTNSDSIDKAGDMAGQAFASRYWTAKSFKSTLEDLCPGVGAAPVVSLLELKTMLNASPYITTPGRFSTVQAGFYKAQTLDTNMYWEVVIEPYCNVSGNCSNGGWSYLPSIYEINVENKSQHKVATSYGFWAPITSFELQKSKLATRSLQLYEGEISYPTGMEFTNELRLTFADDSWKSWRRYFEKCAKVAIYNSTPHNSSFYLNVEPDLTKIDEKHVCISLYKNIAFNIRVYMLNPQFNTIKKYDLLCVLKDFSEEYVGEVDSAGTDLNVTFSIVGENPSYNTVRTINEVFATVKNVLNVATLGAIEAKKIAVGAIKNSIGLL